MDRNLGQRWPQNSKPINGKLQGERKPLTPDWLPSAVDFSYESYVPLGPWVSEPRTSRPRTRPYLRWLCIYTVHPLAFDVFTERRYVSSRIFSRLLLYWCYISIWRSVAVGLFSLRLGSSTVLMSVCYLLSGLRPLLDWNEMIIPANKCWDKPD